MNDFRKRILEPLAIPLASVAFIGMLVWGLSRFLLVTSTEMAVVIAFVASLMIVLVAGFMSTGRRFTLAQKLALGLLAVGIAVGGEVSVAMIGIRPFHKHEPPADVELVAKGIAFLEKELSITDTAKKIYNVELENQDRDLHNFALYRDPGRTQTIFKGTVFPGVATRPNVFDNPGPGIYFYQCDVHPLPAMQGVLRIGPPPGGGPPGPGGPGGSGPAGSPSPGTPQQGPASPAAHIIFFLPLLQRRPES